MSAVFDIVGEALENDFYRRVVYTGERSQLVVMSLLPNEGIGTERHRAVEQTLFIVYGYGTVILGGRRERVGPGDAVVVTPRTRHNLVADAESTLKLFTVYTPPNHIDGRVHETRADAEADVADREFGERVEERRTR